MKENNNENDNKNEDVNIKLLEDDHQSDKNFDN